MVQLHLGPLKEKQNICLSLRNWTQVNIVCATYRFPWFMTTSWHGNAFHVTDPLRGEPLVLHTQKTGAAHIWGFLWYQGIKHFNKHSLCRDLIRIGAHVTGPSNRQIDCVHQPLMRNTISCYDVIVQPCALRKSFLLDGRSVTRKPISIISWSFSSMVCFYMGLFGHW